MRKFKDTMIFTGLIVLAPVLMPTVTKASDCTIDVAVTKPTAKTYYLNNGTTLSSTIVERLKSQCTFNVRVLSSKEYKVIQIRRLNAQLTRLQGKG